MKGVAAQNQEKEGGAEEGIEGVKAEELSPTFTPGAQLPTPGLKTRLRPGHV